MNSFGKVLIGLGGLLMLVGVIFVLAGRANVPLGRLPGDISYRGRNTAFNFPITTSIVLSILLSLIMWLVNRFMR